MLVVNIKLWPKGYGGDKPSKTWQAIIFNDGTGNENSGNYHAVFIKANRKATLFDIMREFKKGKRHEAVWGMAELTDFPRRRLGPWHLLKGLIDGIIK